MLLGELDIGTWDLGTVVLSWANSHCGHSAPSDSSFLPPNNHLNLYKEQWCFRPRNCQGFLHSTHWYIKGNTILDFCHGARRPNQDLVILMITVSYNPMSEGHQLLRKGKNVHIYIYKYTSLVPGEARFLRSIQCGSISCNGPLCCESNLQANGMGENKVNHCTEIATLVLVEPVCFGVYSSPMNFSWVGLFSLGPGRVYGICVPLIKKWWNQSLDACNWEGF